jgi:hypothetical protein
MQIDQTKIKFLFIDYENQLHELLISLADKMIHDEENIVVDIKIEDINTQINTSITNIQQIFEQIRINTTK